MVKVLTMWLLNDPYHEFIILDWQTFQSKSAELVFLLTLVEKEFLNLIRCFIFCKKIELITTLSIIVHMMEA